MPQTIGTIIDWLVSSVLFSGFDVGFDIVVSLQRIDWLDFGRTSFMISIDINWKSIENLLRTKKSFSTESPMKRLITIWGSYFSRLLKPSWKSHNFCKKVVFLRQHAQAISLSYHIDVSDSKWKIERNIFYVAQALKSCIDGLCCFIVYTTYM